MGRFHRHADGTVHTHDHDHGSHDHEHVHDGHDARGDAVDFAAYADTGTQRVEVLERLFAENDRVAAANRQALCAAGVRTVNLMSAPGAGKTSLLRRTLALTRGTRIGILEGDIETSLDADRLVADAAAVALVNTSAGFGGECHLDAVMVRAGLDRLPLGDLDVVVIENVGNLVCPAEFDVGEDAKAMVCAVTEGEEKPLKYPVMFRAVDVVVVNKVDLLPFLDFDLGLLRENLARVNPGVRVICTSARTGEGVAEWCDWLCGPG